MKKFIFIVLSLTFFFFVSCEKENENEDENETKISRNNTDESHNSGQNCMNCHVSGGGGEGWFILAGTLYDQSLTNTYPNGSVKLTTATGGTGTTVKVIEVDNRGNFYTTESIDFGTGLYVSVVGRNGEQKFMPSKITSGACNSCHGNTTGKIWIE